MSVNMEVAARSEPTDRPWITFSVICTGVLMVTLDSTIVIVALPSLGHDLQLSSNALAWLLNSYMVTFGGFLLLAGRLGDLYGYRRTFLLGVGAFSVASLFCGLSWTPEFLFIARAVQGVAGASVMAVALSLVVRLFPSSGDRAIALGVYGSICALGGTLGTIFGGIVTSALSWHWIFLVNVPAGVAVCALTASLLTTEEAAKTTRRLDVGGAVTLTAAMALTVYALSNPNRLAQENLTAVCTFGTIALLIALFVAIERRVEVPMLPRELFRLTHFRTSGCVAALWAAGSYGAFAIAALYLQRILHSTPLQVSLYLLPNTLVGAVLSVTASKKIIARYGPAAPAAVGILLFALGIAWLSRAPLDGGFIADILPAMLLMGVGDGIGSAPLLLIALQGVDPGRSGIASGIINTSWVLGGAAGIAACFSASDLRMLEMQHTGFTPIMAADAGYQAALFCCVVLTLCAAICAALGLRLKNRVTGGD
jgi:EmrB/QacA subfamily drug resistance transporter